MPTTKSYNVRIKNRQDTHANWISADPVLLVGEVAIATEVPMAGSTEQNPILGTFLKSGNGSSKYSELPFLTAEANIYSWAKAATKPQYTANEVQGLSAYINNEVQDTDTQYRIVNVDNDGLNYKLQSTKTPDVEGSWTDVPNGSFKVTTVAAGTAAGNIKIDGVDVPITGFKEVSDKVNANETAIATLNGSATTAGSVAKAVKDGDDAVLTTLREEIDSKISSTYKPAGSLAPADLVPSLLIEANEGKVYNMTDTLTTTADFVEGADKTYPAGTNVVIIPTGSAETPVYKFDVLAGFVDLSGYYNKTQAQDMAEDTVTAMLTTDANTDLDGKVLTKKIKDFDTSVATSVDNALSAEGDSAIKTTVKEIADASATTIATKIVSDTLKDPANLPDITSDKVTDFDASAVSAVDAELKKTGDNVELKNTVKGIADTSAETIVTNKLSDPANLPTNIPTSSIANFGADAVSAVNTAIGTEGSTINGTVKGIADASAETIATTKISGLKNEDALVAGQFVTLAKQTDGVVTVNRAAVDISMLAQATGDTIIFDCGSSGAAPTPNPAS